MEIRAPYFDETPWDTLPVAQKDELMRRHATLVKKYPKNTRVPLDAQSAECFYLYKGQAKLFISNEAGIERLLYYVEEKNSCACGYPNITMTLETAGECEIYYVNMRQLMETLIYQEHLFDQFWASTHRRLGSMAERILDIGGCSNKGKICKLLYNLAQESTITEDGCIVIKRLPSRNDIAFFVGTYKTNVVKCLSNLEREQIIERDGKRLLIKDMDALAAIIAEEYQLQ